MIYDSFGAVTPKQIYAYKVTDAVATPFSCSNVEPFCENLINVQVLDCDS